MFIQSLKDFTKKGSRDAAMQNGDLSPHHSQASVSPGLRKRLLLELWEWIRVVLSAFVIAYFVTHVIILNTIVPSGSMETTIPCPSRLICFRFSYWFSSPERGDVVIFDPPDGGKDYYVKRIVGLPGETVQIKEGLVFINDSNLPLMEPYLSEEPFGDFGPYTVPEGHYFVLGDNRNHSLDARYWTNTYVSEDAIHAKAIFGYWPHFFRIQ